MQPLAHAQMYIKREREITNILEDNRALSDTLKILYSLKTKLFHGDNNA